jgi:AcrR family transcriptional regulator
VVSNQRERLLDAVLQVVERKGYAKMSVEDVIALAGVSRRTFYDHFSNKEDAFLAAYDLVVEQLGTAVTAAYDATADGWPANVARGLDALLRLLAGEPALAHVCIVEVLAAGPNALARRERTMERFRAFLEPGLDASATGPPAPLLAVELVVGGIYEVIYSYVVSDRTQELPEVLPELLHGLLLPFAGAEVAAAESARTRACLAERAERALASSSAKRAAGRRPRRAGPARARARAARWPHPG